jgi:HTH-type transcriptional regulator/antitoxin HigA
MGDYSACNTPGQLIRTLLDERGWSQRVLAIVLDVDETGVNKMVCDRRPVSAEMSVLLGEVFDIRAEEFLTRQKDFDLATARFKVRPDPSRENRARLFGSLPVSEMIQRRWIRAEDLRDVATVEAELARFFGAERPEDIEILPHAAKKTQVASDVTPSQLAWLYRVRQIAGEMLVPKYSETALRAAIQKLRELLMAAEAARKVPRVLAECGVRFVMVESLSSAKIDGVCFWLSEGSPVVSMSVRYDRIDNFWFVLRHELEHVLQGHGKGIVALDAELEGKRAGTGEDIPDQERVANAAAADFCVPSRQMDSFIARKSPYFAERDIIGFSRTLGVHPGLVAGQLQHRTGRYDLFRKFLVKIRHAVAPSAMVDGWGDVAPVDI